MVLKEQKSENVTKVQLFVNDNLQRTATLNGNNYEVYVKDVIVSASDKVEIIALINMVLKKECLSQ
ncbi:immunoglobulin-like domain-containing protein [Enterococcus mundtii]|uniref:immunoglobulin-like domain-containing protein n=1 Tax=Enterococcus mundtii TaxID=53346 RepID=UPI003B984830